MISEALRAAAGLVADPIHLNPRTEPGFGAATWLTGVSPGHLLAAEEVAPVGLGTRWNPAQAWRIDYATSDRCGRVLTATGAVFRSRSPWRGRGPQPTIAFAPSTQGVARRCDPSYSCTVGVGVRRRPWDAIAAYEQPAINLLLAHGANVVLTDYPRDPEDEVQLYCDHTSAARSLADACRAASTLGIQPDNLGLWGFSQGGGAIAAWLEQPEYAPELQPRAAVVGAPPADLAAMLDHVDGAMASVVILYAVAGILASDPRLAAEITPHLSDEGLEAVLFDARVCAAGAVLKRPWEATRAWTRHGVTMARLLEELPLTSEYLAQTRLGQRRPLRVPIRLWSSRHDDLVPYATVAALADEWGVPLVTRRFPSVPARTGVSHFGPYFTYMPGDAEWLLRRLGR